MQKIHYIFIMNKINNNRYYFQDDTRYYVKISMVSYFNTTLLVG